LHFWSINCPVSFRIFCPYSCFWLIIFACVTYSNLICFCWILWFTCNITIILSCCYWCLGFVLYNMYRRIYKKLTTLGDYYFYLTINRFSWLSGFRYIRIFKPTISCTSWQFIGIFNTLNSIWDNSHFSSLLFRNWLEIEISCFFRSQRQRTYDGVLTWIIPRSSSQCITSISNIRVIR